jgi:hypothetical protein
VQGKGAAKNNHMDFLLHSMGAAKVPLAWPAKVSDAIA